MIRGMKRLGVVISSIVIGCTGCMSTAATGSYEQKVQSSVEPTQEIDDMQEDKIQKDKMQEEHIYKEIETDSAGQIDYDLSTMSNEMAYVMLYQIGTDPEQYIGKTLKIRGSYYAIYDEETQKYYHYVVIFDSAACCSQGIEFIWEDGIHIYPDDYPLDKTEIEVVGQFEAYTEEGDSSLYARLCEASLEVID